MHVLQRFAVAQAKRESVGQGRGTFSHDGGLKLAFSLVQPTLQGSTRYVDAWSCAVAAHLEAQSELVLPSLARLCIFFAAAPPHLIKSCGSCVLMFRCCRCAACEVLSALSPHFRL